MPRKITTELIQPPIPTQRFDWAAYYDDYDLGCVVGYGSTEQEAIQELKEMTDDE